MKATVLNTVENTTRVVDLPESVTDLAGLKHFIEIEEGQFFEGTTHTDLTSDYQALPTLPESKREKGYVFFVSPVQNKMKNGAYTRKECYAVIKQHNLGERVKQEFGRNFTQVATDALNNFITNNADVIGSGSEDVENRTPVADVDAGKITTEKEFVTALVDTFAKTTNASYEDIKPLLDGIERVFPNPYSVQDLANMRK